MTREDTTAVSVVMITRDRRGSALRAIDRLRALPERPPVIVVDNGSSDGTATALRDADGVTVADLGYNAGAAGRNVGVELARTPYVAFADDDSWWAPGALTAAAAVFDRYPRVAVLVARTLVGPEQDEDPLNAQLAAAPFGRRPDLPGPTAVGFLACAAIVRRQAFLAVGGFHPRFGVGGEEQLLALDLTARGWGVAYRPDLVAHHHPAPGSDRVGRAARQVRNDIWTVWLRRRWPTVLRRTGRLAARAVRDPVARMGLGQAVAGLPWIVRERSALSPALERLLAVTPAPRPGGGRH